LNWFVILFLFICFSFCRYIYYFENDNPVIAVRFLSGLIALINEQLGPDAAVSVSATGRSVASVQSHYRNTLEYLQNRQRDPETAEKFSAIQLS
jgi:hypothetical protein